MSVFEGGDPAPRHSSRTKALIEKTKALIGNFEKMVLSPEKSTKALNFTKALLHTNELSRFAWPDGTR